MPLSNSVVFSEYYHSDKIKENREENISAIVVNNLISVPDITFTESNEVAEVIQKHKILIVDDERTNCDIIYGFLLMLGIQNRNLISKFAYDGQ